MPRQPNWLFPLLEGLLKAIQEPLSPTELLESRREMEQIFRERGLYWKPVRDIHTSNQTSPESRIALEDDALPSSQAKEIPKH